jgi:hypothetical protein
VLSCVSPSSAQRSVARDNCYRDQAVANAAQLADLLDSANVRVVSGDA